ncbi:jg3875 [Pararge aegeria aegeria]|uniref:Jg3875 protein n=1 Tax=Pararge aegeria aegeria TaxID=348720 RepID=A0A8S4S3Y4_9NEOP|nr:jg3875 [Pararge aegeria aegeria]
MQTLALGVYCYRLSMIILFTIHISIVEAPAKEGVRDQRVRSRIRWRRLTLALAAGACWTLGSDDTPVVCPAMQWPDWAADWR